MNQMKEAELDWEEKRVAPDEVGDAPWAARCGDPQEAEADALKSLRQKAVEYARTEIWQYGCWRGLEEPVLPDGYDAEAIAQAAFETLLARDAGDVPIIYTGEDTWKQLRRLIKHRVWRLHEREERRVVLGEWDVDPPGADGKPVSVFARLAGRIRPPDLEVMEAEKARLLGEFKAGFEASLGKRQEEREVFQRIWDGEKRGAIARGLGLRVARVADLQKRLRGRLAEFGAKAGGAVKEMISDVVGVSRRGNKGGKARR